MAEGLEKSFRARRPHPLARPGPDLRAVTGAALEIAPGEVLGLAGESGSGKTTLARLLARLENPDAGSIRLEGREIGAVPARRFAADPARRAVQMVFQDPVGSLNPRFTVARIIAEPCTRLIPREQAEARVARLRRAAADAGLSERLLTRFPHQLSGGEAARVGIARAIAVEPRLLILDEPTSSLDVTVQARILHLLDRLRRDRGLAMLFISHDLSVLRLLADRVAVMQAGRIVECAATAALFAAPCHPHTQALMAAIPRLDPPPRATAGGGG